ncbi:hypothetical protein [Fictibacillus sp. FJAT-27399]|uniref:hypothetical protein n=1 Tax=Fictibacillus sp. FJAT-27399 TaxID=1729689 RepID=UPI000785AEA4|nr:hypothetical protein [Fictibacillus sp. FJAT-27399]
MINQYTIRKTTEADAEQILIHIQKVLEAYPDFLAAVQKNSILHLKKRKSGSPLMKSTACCSWLKSSKRLSVS